MKTCGSFLVTALLVFLGCPADSQAPLDGDRGDPSSDVSVTSLPLGMVLVPAGTFSMGSKDFVESQPVHDEKIASFYLDETEVTADSYQACIDEKKCSVPSVDVRANPFCNYDAVTNKPVSGKEKHPANCITFEQAKQYCLAQGKRLPTEAEWEYAARGRTGGLFSWGNTDPSDQGCFGQPMQGTCAVKSFRPMLLGMEQASLDKEMLRGVYDLTGNVWEWVDTENEDSFSNPMKACSKNCAVKGGSWYNTLPAHLRASLRLKDASDFLGAELGFRCAKSMK